MQANAASLFDRALRGERIDRANLRVQDSNGMYRELEASLSCRQDRGEPVSVRCIFRDVTQQYQRERRLAMQLAVSQVVGESTTSDEALPAMLESLGTNLGFDMAGLWFVSSDHHCRYLAGWYAPDRACIEFHRDSIGRVLQKGKDLPGQIWAAESPCWIEDLGEDTNFLRATSAKTDGLVTGWGVPVRVGNQVIAVVEFFSRQKQREDTEMMATVETVCASIGQFMARSAQESRLEELNRQKESILNSVADGIFGTDSAGRIVFVNPAAASMLGAHAFDLIGRTVHSVVHEERKGREKCSDQCRTGRAFLVREGTSGQDVFYRRNGASFPVEFSVTPMVEHNIAVGSVLSFRDISQRYALDRMKDEFVSTVSHELRTPLTSIRGSLGLLSTGLLGEMGEKASNLLRIAVNNSDRLVRLINDILDLERMQSGRAPLTYRNCDLEELARQAIDAMTPMAEAAKVQLLLEAGPAQVEVDPDRLQQVMTNLLSNAIKFSPAGSQVTVSLERLLDGVTISVQRQRPRHSQGQAGVDLRPLPASRCLRRQAKGRNRTGPRHLPHHRHAARRPHLGRAQYRSRLYFPHVPALGYPGCGSVPPGGRLCFLDGERHRGPGLRREPGDAGYAGREPAAKWLFGARSRQRRRGRRHGPANPDSGHPAGYEPSQPARLGDAAPVARRCTHRGHPGGCFERLWRAQRS